jgi:hypothetical protein
MAKLIRDLSGAGRIDDALNLEAVWYQHLVKQIESETNYFEAFRWHKDQLFNAGLMSREKTASSDPEKIAFVIPNGVLLGHTQVLLKILRDWGLDRRPIKPHVLSLSSFASELAEPLRDLSVGIHCPDSSSISPSQAIVWCRDRIRELGCETAVWVSVPIWASYALGVGLAPKQVFWSLKFHPVHFGDPIRHIGMTPPGEGQIIINGCPWSRFSPPLTLNSKFRSNEEIAHLRRSLGNKFVFGSLARTEKFNSLEFVSAAAEIVSKCPGSIFIYTGADDSALVRKVFEERNLARSAIYVGWVDTELYAQSIDVFLETFPFGCGVTGAQAVDMFTKTVSLWCNETLPRYYFESFANAASACDHWSIATGREDYIKHAIKFYERKSPTPRKEYDSRVLLSLDKAKSAAFYNLLQLPG